MKNININCSKCNYPSFIPLDEYTEEEQCALCNARMIPTSIVDLNIYLEYRNNEMAEWVANEMLIESMQRQIKQVGKEKMWTLIEKLSNPIYRAKCRIYYAKALLEIEK